MISKIWLIVKKLWFFLCFFPSKFSFLLMFLLSLINLIDSYELNNHYYRNSISKWADFINVQRKMFKNLSFMNFRFFNNDNFCFDPIFNYLLSHKKKENKNICIYTSKRNVKLLLYLIMILDLMNNITNI